MQLKLHLAILAAVLTAGTALAGPGNAQSSPTAKAAPPASVGLSMSAAAEFCAGKALASADQAECRSKMQTATGDLHRAQIRDAFTARAGSAASSASSTAATPAPHDSSSGAPPASNGPGATPLDSSASGAIGNPGASPRGTPH